jgi:acetate kinase
VELDTVSNHARGPRITKPGSRVAAYVIPTDENLMIARQTRALVG